MLAVLLLISLLTGSFQGIAYAAEDNLPLQELDEDLNEIDLEEDEPVDPREFEITYELNGGENHSDNSTSYLAGTEVILNEPQREGYSFKGWYLDSRLKEKINVITTLEIAEMMEVEHKEILKKLEGTTRSDGSIKQIGIIPVLAKGNFPLSDYFIISSYIKNRMNNSPDSVY